MSREDEDRLYYFTGSESCTDGGLVQAKHEIQREFFLTQLPDSVEKGARGYDDDDDYESKGPHGKSPVEMKQTLLRYLATDLVIQKAIHGEVSILQTDLKWFGTSLSHSTILAICKFFGIPAFWLDFFHKFLGPPIQWSDDSHNPEPVRIRKRGVQMATAFEQFFGEIILFPLDLAVNLKADGMHLFRMHDDLCMSGRPSSVGKAWKVIQEYCALMGLEFNDSKTGSAHLHNKKNNRNSKPVNLPKGNVSFGFLRLEPEIGEWIIDRDQVDRHTQQLRKQLAKCTSIFSWIQTWNSCIGRFFSRTFGETANCFGGAHADSILQMHKEIQQEIFGQQKITDHLRGLIRDKFGAAVELPDAFFFFPEEMGGLGLRNPFINLLVSREDLIESPGQRMQAYLDNTRAAYEKDKAAFQALSPYERRRRARDFVGLNTSAALGELTYEDYTRHQEIVSLELEAVFEDLMSVPSPSDIIPSEVLNEIDWPAWQKLESEQKWLIQLYAQRVVDTFGGLKMVDKTLLPLGIMTLLKNQKVSWQAVL